MSHDRCYRVIVPTRDGAEWIRPIAEAYRALGVRPLYLYDTRSADGTFAVLEDLGADVAPVTPTSDRVEGIISVSRDVVETEWVVRFDDDELPSAALIAWLDRSLARVAEPSLALSRRNAWVLHGELRFSRLEDHYFHPQDPTYLDPQWRAFRPREVDFVDAIHTRGFTASQSDMAPQWAFFVHFDWIVRSFEQRCAKLTRYDRQSPGAGWSFARFYLPELHAAEDLRWTPFETDEFNCLARRLARISAAAT